MPTNPVAHPKRSARAGKASEAARHPFGRVLLKLSGESFCSAGGFGVEGDELDAIAREVLAAAKAGAQVAVVVGGGNIIRGASLSKKVTFPQAAADAMGMLGTLINAVALAEQLRALGADARAVSAIPSGGVAELFSRVECIRHLEAGRIVVLGGGTGNPFFTTDTCASLRAAELECDILMKATKVDGVYSADPKTDRSATRFDTLTFEEALRRNLKVMDLAALAMCQEQKVPLLVFDFYTKGNIAKAVKGGAIGTLVTP